MKVRIRHILLVLMGIGCYFLLLFAYLESKAKRMSSIGTPQLSRPVPQVDHISTYPLSTPNSAQQDESTSSPPPANYVAGDLSLNAKLIENVLLLAEKERRKRVEAEERHSHIDYMAHLSEHPPHPDIHLFVIWNGAADRTEAILADVVKQFIVLKIGAFHWPLEGKAFRDNLWRLYSGKGGWERKGMELKVKQCGKGDFIALIVLDPEPSYKIEHTAHGADLVSHKINMCKNKYRKMSGGGFRVHGTFNPVEAEHDILLLFHQSKEEVFEEFRKSHGASSRGLVLLFLRDMKENAVDVAKSRGVKNSNSLFAVENQTFGFPRWNSCSDLALGVGAIPSLRFFQGADLQTSPLKPVECETWPQDITASMATKDLWSVVALLNGVPKDASQSAPSVFATSVGEKSFTFRVHPLDGDPRRRELR